MNSKLNTFALPFISPGYLLRSARCSGKIDVRIGTAALLSQRTYALKSACEYRSGSLAIDQLN